MLAAKALAMPFSGATVSVASASSEASTMGMDVVVTAGASAGIGCSLGAIEVVLATGAVIGAASSKNVGALTGAGDWGTDTPECAALDSKRGHQLFSTSWGSF